MLSALQVSDSRAKVVINEIRDGSDTHWRFYAMLITSAMIACFGLAANSSAVIIGAMLVSPLMTPIFGVALGMLLGDTRLLIRALAAETVGAILAIASAYLMGAFQFTGGEATTEMIARTHPNLLDLLVAVFAGFAGAYALVDERISPALPGVAIATAIVPPLSTCGLCLSMGAWGGAGGALLLFLANFVSILIVALLTFAICGLARPRHVETMRGFVRHFGLPIFTFILVTVVLTQSLLDIMELRKTKKAINDTLIAELSNDHAVDLEEFKHKLINGRLQVLATVRSPRILKSRRVKQIQDHIHEKVGEPVDLIVRNVLSKDVTPTGSSLQVVRPNLNGAFMTQVADDFEGQEALAEQVIREYFENEPGFELTNVEFGASGNESIVLAFLNTIRRLSRSEISDVQDRLCERFDDQSIRFFARVSSGELQFAEGPVRVEWTSWRGATDAERESLPEAEQIIRATIQELIDIIPLHVHFNIEGGYRRILVEAVGPNPVSPMDAKLVQDQLAASFGVPVDLNIWYRNQFVVNPDGYTTYERISDPSLDHRTRLLREMFQSTDGTADASTATTYP